MMKGKFSFQVLCFFVLVLGSHSQLLAQPFFGFKGGVNYSLSSIGIGKAADEVAQIVSDQRVNDGWHLGFVNRNYFMDRTHFLQFETNFNQSSFTLLGDNNFSYNLNQSAAELNGLFGFELLRFIRLQGGLSSRLTMNERYRDTFEAFSLGYLLGTGFTIGKFNADLSYNAAFSSLDGEFQGVPLRHQHSQVLLNIGFLF